MWSGFLDEYEDMSSYDRFLLRQAEEAMNDREVGLLGQCRAARDADQLRNGTFYDHRHDDTSETCQDLNAILGEVEEPASETCGIPVISW